VADYLSLKTNLINIEMLWLEYKQSPTHFNINWRQIMDLIRILVAIVLPPLGVFLQVGIGADFWINILLTLFGYFPGIIHAVWVIAKK